MLIYSVSRVFQGLISTTMNFGIFDVVKMYLQAELKSDME